MSQQGEVVNYVSRFLSASTSLFPQSVMSCIHVRVWAATPLSETLEWHFCCSSEFPLATTGTASWRWNHTLSSRHLEAPYLESRKHCQGFVKVFMSHKRFCICHVTNLSGIHVFDYMSLDRIIWCCKKCQKSYFGMSGPALHLLGSERFSYSSLQSRSSSVRSELKAIVTSNFRGF